MERRRLEDRAPGVLLASLAGARATPSAGQSSTPHATGGVFPGRDDFPPLLLVHDDGGPLLCMAGGAIWRLPRPDGVALEDLAVAVAENVRQYHAAALQKQRFNEGFMVFVERLNRARARRDVYDALLDQVPQLMGVYAAVLLVAARADGADLELLAVADRKVPFELGALRASEVLTRPVPALITEADTVAGGPYFGLQPLFTRLGARQLTCMALGGQGVLVLIERRHARDFSGEEWFRLQTLAHHAQRSMERLELAAHAASAVESIALR